MWENFGEQSNPHPSPSHPFKAEVFVVSYRYTVATCTTLNKGRWEGKALFFPFEASRPLKCPLGQSVSTSFVPDCSVEFYFFPAIINNWLNLFHNQLSHCLKIWIDDWLKSMIETVILLPLCPASLTHRNPQRCKIIHGMHPVGCKDR